ncbi:hypothetical protein MJO29_007500 [Puccinia striiformis f. sp. tritici]|nr:hypothetical protein MJO29_007500 [Puccinia striiformis f. sp. tritici]
MKKLTGLHTIFAYPSSHATPSTGVIRTVPFPKAIIEIHNRYRILIQFFNLLFTDSPQISSNPSEKLVARTKP